MRQYILDIETLGCITPQMRDYKIDAIRPRGGLTDPKKVVADIEKKLSAIEGKAALSPTTGRVLCVGIKRVDTANDFAAMMFLAHTQESESKILLRASEYVMYDILRNRQFEPWSLITWNGQAFDIPFLIARTAINGLRIPWPHPLGKNHCDVSLALGHFEAQAEWSIAMLGRRPSASGKDVADMVSREDYDAVVQHCREDVETLAEIYRRVSGACDLWR